MQARHEHTRYHNIKAIFVHHIISLCCRVARLNRAILPPFQISYGRVPRRSYTKNAPATRRKAAVCSTVLEGVRGSIGVSKQRPSKNHPIVLSPASPSPRFFSSSFLFSFFFVFFCFCSLLFSLSLPFIDIVFRLTQNALPSYSPNSLRIRFPRRVLFQCLRRT